MDTLLNMIKGQSTALDGARGQPRFGVVSSVDPTRFTVRVTLQPEGVLSGWLPVLAPWIGAGWGMACPPAPGDQVLVLPQEGDAQHGVVIGRAWSDTQATPGAPVGELWLMHQSGSFLKLANDGSVQIKGDVHVNGRVIATGDVQAGTVSLQQHVHTGVQVGGALTGMPKS